MQRLNPYFFYFFSFFSYFLKMWGTRSVWLHSYTKQQPSLAAVSNESPKLRSHCGCSLRICAGLCFQSSWFSNGVINTVTAFLQGFCSTGFLIWLLEAAAQLRRAEMKWEVGRKGRSIVTASTWRCLKLSVLQQVFSCTLQCAQSAPTFWPEFYRSELEIHEPCVCVCVCSSPSPRVVFLPSVI